MRALTVAVAVCCLALPASALPLITSSEDTLARTCLSRAASPARLVEACDRALAEPGLTRAQQVSLITARADGNLWLDRFAQSEADYRAALALNPRSIEAWNGLGWALWEFAGDAAAHEAFEASLSVGVSVQGLGGMAATGRRLGLVSNEDARQMLRAALAIDPDYIWAHRELAWSHLDAGDAAMARRHFEAALEIEPKDVNARFGLGRAHLASHGRGSRAERLQRRSCRCPRLPDAGLSQHHAAATGAERPGAARSRSPDCQPPRPVVGIYRARACADCAGAPARGVGYICRGRRGAGAEQRDSLLVRRCAGRWTINSRKRLP